jgi:hypothetical protein
MREREVAKVYFREVFGSFAVYAMLLVAVHRGGRPMEPGPWRMLVLTSPMLGFFLMEWAIVRQFKRIDEFIRQLSLENVAIAAAVTASWTFTYGFLENAGYPRLSMFTVFPVMSATCGAIAIVRSLLHRC